MSALGRAARGTLASIGALTVASGAGLFWDYKYHYGRVNRSLRTVRAGFQTWADFEWHWDEEKFEEIHERIAKRWYDVCCENAGLYVKLGQTVSLMGHVLPPVYTQTFTTLQDQAPIVSYEEIEKVFYKDFGKTPKEVYAEFDEIAIASASIAQVHRAVLHDGRKVAVKIQKPYIEDQLPYDLFVYKSIVQLFEWWFEIPMYWTVPPVVASLNDESNFLIEAENTKKASRLLEHQMGDRGPSYVPQVYDDYTTEKVLTMEWIDGVKITSTEDLQRWGFGKKQFQSMIIREFAYQLFVTGFVHSDPHPGNILIRPRPGAEHLPQIVIIDHGLYMEQQPQFRRDYASFWHALVMSDQVRLHEVCKRWGIEDIQLFASLQLMKPYKANEDVILSGFTVDDVKGLRGTAKSRAIVMLQQAQAIPEDLVMIGRHLNILRGTNKLLGSPVNRVALMAEYAMRGYHSSQRGSMVGVGLLARARIRSDVFRESMSFHLRMVWLGILYYWITFVRFWQTMLGKEKAQDFDQFMKKEFAQKGFGLKISTDVDIPL